jgi:hypothetical protein
LPPVEVFVSYSPEPSKQSSWSGQMGYYRRSQIPDSATLSNQPPPSSSSDDQPSPAPSLEDQSSPQATTPQYTSINSSPVPEAFDPSLVLSLPLTPSIDQSPRNSPTVIPTDYQQHTLPPLSSGLEAMSGCLPRQGFASAAGASDIGFPPEPSPDPLLLFPIPPL